MRRLVMLTKAAVPGRVKTRLGGRVGLEVAAQGHRAFLADLAGLVSSVREVSGGALSFELCVDDGGLSGSSTEGFEVGGGVVGLDPSLAELALEADVVTAQVSGDLGARLVDVFARSRAAGGQGPVVVIGSDSPTLPVALLVEAFLALEGGQDVVFGPSLDGGYYLVGVSEGVCVESLFDGVPWSCAETLRESVLRGLRLGMRVWLGKPWYDVDHFEDLELLSAGASGGGLSVCGVSPAVAPCTASWLLGLGSSVGGSDGERSG